MENENGMRNILIEKVTVNMGIGNAPEEFKKAEQIMARITGSKAVHTLCRVKLPKWDIRPGLPIGLKVTLRGTGAIDFLKRALAAKENTLKKNNFDSQGCFGFGIKEYIDLPGTKYEPALGIRGFDVLVTLKRPGFRVKRRKIRNAKIGKKHLIKREDAIAFVQKTLGVEII